MRSMSDDLTKRRPQDANKVNIHESWEREYWCKHFGCTLSKLTEAVNAVGTSVTAVEKYLRTH